MKLIIYFFSFILLSSHAFANLNGFEFACKQQSNQSNDLFSTAWLTTGQGKIELEFGNALIPNVGEYYLSSIGSPLGARTQFSEFGEYNKSSGQKITVVHETVIIDNAFFSNIWASGQMTVKLGNSLRTYNCTSLAGS